MFTDMFNQINLSSISNSFLSTNKQKKNNTVVDSQQQIHT